MQKPIALRNAFGLGLEVCVANKLTPIGPAVQLQIKMVCGRPLTRFAGVSPLVGAGFRSCERIGDKGSDPKGMLLDSWHTVRGSDPLSPIRSQLL